jgi:hypothetical protein
MTDQELERAIINAIKPMEPQGLVVKRLAAVAQAYKESA